MITKLSLRRIFLPLSTKHLLRSARTSVSACSWGLAAASPGRWSSPIYLFRMVRKCEQRDYLLLLYALYASLIPPLSAMFSPWGQRLLSQNAWVVILAYLGIDTVQRKVIQLRKGVIRILPNNTLGLVEVSRNQVWRTCMTHYLPLRFDQHPECTYLSSKFLPN